MLHWRLVLSMVFVPTMIALAWLDGQMPVRGVVLVPLAIIVSALAAQELIGLFASAGLRASRWVIHTGCVLVVLANGAAHWLDFAQHPAMGYWGLPALAFAIAVGIAFWDGIYRYKQPQDALSRFALATVGVAYVGWLMGFLVQLIWIGPGGRGDGTWGIFALLSLLIVVKLGDVGAYTVGRIVGQTKLAPAVSPGKTIEGLLGGLVFSWLGAAFTWIVLAPWVAGRPISFTPHSAWLAWSAFAVAANLAGTLGDLAESLLKRSVGRKDSSYWMPGFGGVLDILDSVLMAGPVAFCFWALEWVTL